MRNQSTQQGGMADRRTRRRFAAEFKVQAVRWPLAGAWVLPSGVGRDEALRESEDRQQSTLLPDWVDAHVTKAASVRVIEA